MVQDFDMGQSACSPQMAWHALTQQVTYRKYMLQMHLNTKYFRQMYLNTE